MSAHERVHAIWSADGWAAATARAALAPAELAFRGTSGLHHLLYDRRIRRAHETSIPVVSVGNLRVGGSGKTPFAAWLVDRLLARGRSPAIVHGGYAADEPELHRRWHPHVPVVGDRDRVQAVAAAAAAGADIAVLDDAFQHRRVARDLDIVLLAAEHLRRPVRLFPAGPWREPLAALGRADLVVVTRKTASASEAANAAGRLARHTRRPPVRAWLRPGPLVRWSGDPVGADGGAQRELGGADGGADGAPAGGAPDAPAGAVVAVAAVAEPRLFFENLRALGIETTATLPWPDHHTYDARDIERIHAVAGERPVVTTAKDAVKLERDVRRLWVLEQRLVLESGAAELEARLNGIG